MSAGISDVSPQIQGPSGNIAEVDADSFLYVTAKQYGSWTAQVTQGTSPWVISGTVTATPDVLNTTGVEGTISVSTSAVEAKVGGSRLTNRVLLTVFNNGPNTVYWGYNSTVTTTSGTPIFKSQFASWDIGSGLGVWLIAATGTQDIRVTEAY